MSFKLKTIGEISRKVFSGGTPSRKKEEYWSNGNIPWLKTNQIGTYKIYQTDEQITKEGLDNSSAKIVKKDSISVAMYGDGVTRGKVSIIGRELSTNQACCNIEVDKNEADYRFVYYALKDNYATLRHLSNGGAQQNLNVTQIKNLQIPIPSIIEQNHIANILSSLDEKIETNNRINQKLEVMAQTIFKHWFVDFEFPNEKDEPYKTNGGEMVDSEIGMIPKGWKVKKLKEMIDNIKSPTKSGIHLSNRKYLPIDTLPMKSVTINDYKSYEEAKSSLILFEKFDILIGAMRVYFHRVNLAPFAGVTRTTTFVLRSKNKYDVSFNLFLLNLPETISYANQSSKGSTMPYAVWDGGLGEMLVAFPNSNIRNEYNKIVLPMLEEMMINAEQNRKLAQLRESLLPKLMSGKIKVSVEN